MADTNASGPVQNRRRVFVVHGRNEAARMAMFRFLRAVGLDPLEWSQAVALTRSGAPYIGQVLDAALAEAHAVVVMFTGDDDARLRPEFVTSNDPAYETEVTGQPRPNVLFEAGMALQRYPERTVLVHIGKSRPFSDIAGRYTVRLDDSADQRNEFVSLLQTVGCELNLSGRKDYLHEGDFDAAVAAEPRTAGVSATPPGFPTQAAGQRVDVVPVAARSSRPEPYLPESQEVQLEWYRTAGGLGVSIRNWTPHTIRDFHLYLTDVRLSYGEEFVETEEFHSAGNFSEKSVTGLLGITVFAHKPAQLPLVRLEGNLIPTLGFVDIPGGNMPGFRNAGIWKLYFRCSWRGGEVKTELMFNWSGPFAPPEPVGVDPT